METYSIFFTDGTKVDISCNQFIIEASGVIKFLDEDKKVLLMVNMYSNVQYILNSKA